LGKSLTDTITTESPPPKKACRKKWAELIQKIYEISPLRCPKCQHEIRIIAFIEKQEPIERILKHLGLWQPHAYAPPQNDKLFFKDDIVYLCCEVDYVVS
jgi:hypothetical protein